MTRSIALLTHAYRLDIKESVAAFRKGMQDIGFDVKMVDDGDDISGAELLVVFGGDGTILRAAEIARGRELPILGINYGHVGFLAEADPSSIREVAAALKERNWSVEKRMTIDITVALPDGSLISGWALNEVSVEKEASCRMIETDLAVDGRGLSSFKADGVLFSTPTGSTAYNFSAGGPIVWPDVEAILMVPIAAHALFTRPMVVGINSELKMHIRSELADVWCDGRRLIPVPADSIVTARYGKEPVLLARVNDAPFSERLVAKFNLPVAGWRSWQPPVIPAPAQTSSKISSQTAKQISKAVPSSPETAAATISEIGKRKP